MRLSHIAPVLLVFSSSALAFSPIVANFKRVDVRLSKSMQAKWSMASTHQESTNVGVDGLHALNRRDMGKMMAGILVGGLLPLASNAEEKGQPKEIKCRSVANTKAEMGGTVCVGIEDVEFKRAFVTTGTATKLSGDAKRMDTYFSQINAGYLTLVDLNERWGQYNSPGDGDVIRRRLGTVGSKSPLHNIRKVFEGAVKVAASSPVVSSDDFDKLDELLNSVLEDIAEVDTSLYSTAFVGTQEVAGQLREKAKVALERGLGKYKSFLSILQTIYDAETKKA